MLTIIDRGLQLSPDKKISPQNQRQTPYEYRIILEGHPIGHTGESWGTDDRYRDFLNLTFIQDIDPLSISGNFWTIQKR